MSKKLKVLKLVRIFTFTLKQNLNLYISINFDEQNIKSKQLLQFSCLKKLKKYILEEKKIKMPFPNFEVGKWNNKLAMQKVGVKKIIVYFFFNLRIAKTGNMHFCRFFFRQLLKIRNTGKLFWEKNLAYLYCSHWY